MLRVSWSVSVTRKRTIEQNKKKKEKKKDSQVRKLD